MKKLSVKRAKKLPIIRKLKFITNLPNVKEAENPFPGAPSPLFVYDMNIWFPEDDIVGGKVFPVKTFN